MLTNILGNKRQLIGAGLSAAAGIGAIALLFYYLAITGAAGISDVWSIDRVVAYLLLLAGPLLLFLPPSIALRLGPLPLLGAIAWAALGYMLIFVEAPRRETASITDYMLFLGALFFAISTLLAVPAGAVGKRLLPPAATTTAETVRAFRQGALAAGAIVISMAMSPLGVLNWLNACLVLIIAVLIEFFFLARD
jgi:hypothetical protein